MSGPAAPTVTTDWKGATDMADRTFNPFITGPNHMGVPLTFENIVNGVLRKALGPAVFPMPGVIRDLGALRDRITDDEFAALTGGAGGDTGPDVSGALAADTFNRANGPLVGSAATTGQSWVNSFNADQFAIADKALRAQNDVQPGLDCGWAALGSIANGVEVAMDVTATWAGDAAKSGGGIGIVDGDGNGFGFGAYGTGWSVVALNPYGSVAVYQPIGGAPVLGQPYHVHFETSGYNVSVSIDGGAPVVVDATMWLPGQYPLAGRRPALWNKNAPATYENFIVNAL